MKSLRANLIHWIAIMAILMSVLAPTISQSINLSTQSNSFETQICSLDGIKTVHMTNSQNPMKEHPFATEHCPYCLVQLTYLPQLMAGLDFQLSQGQFFFPDLFYHSPKPLFAWRTLPSRAPPFIA